MSTIEGRIYDLKIQGYCCSQLVGIIAGLEPLDEDNESLVRSLRGLCFGMYAQKVCGALTGGACALSLHLEGINLAEACRDLTEWFEVRFGGVSCEDLVGRGGRSALVCMDAVKETCEKCLEMLIERDCL